jgi:agmatine deiminase
MTVPREGSYGVKTALEAGYTMPAEWAPHDRCWMAWPCSGHWDDGPGLETIRGIFADVALAIRRFEPLSMIANPADVVDARTRLGPTIDVLPLTFDSEWFRDSGPSFVTDGQGGLAATCWRFNAWGAKAECWDEDATVAPRLAEEIGVPTFRSELCIEGGGLHVDGEGTVLTTETVVLNDNRNPGLAKADAEALLCQGLGARKIIWLPGGTKTFTDGHVDGLACFVRPGVALALMPADPAHPKYDIYAENLRALRLASDAKGRKLDVCTIIDASEAEPTGEHFIRTYVNFYIANSGIIVPGYGVPSDETARETIQGLFPDREVVTVQVAKVAGAGGAIHCITQQQPRM